VFPIVVADGRVFDVACSVMLTGRLSMFDALLLATAREAGCTVLLSEDMQDGAEFDGLVVRNPLRGDRLPEDLAPLLGFG
jgi:predicted nucleic acid-binding protein